MQSTTLNLLNATAQKEMSKITTFISQTKSNKSQPSNYRDSHFIAVSLLHV